MDDTRREQKDLVTRRRALTVAGAATVLAWGRTWQMPAALAQEASPVAAPEAGSQVGQHVVVRIRTVKPEHSAEEIQAKIQEGFVPLLEEIPGLAWYVVAVNPETRGLYSVGVFAAQEEIEQSNHAASAWVAETIPDVFEGNPAIHDGIIHVATAAPDMDLRGKYVVIRLRQANPDWPVGEVMGLIEQGYVPLVEAIPGFVTYIGSADADSSTQAYVGVFEALAGAEESTRLAGEWLRENDYTFFDDEPVVAEGEIGSSANAEG